MDKKIKLIRITTVPQSLRGLLKGQLKFMSEHGFEVIGISSAGEALADVKKNEGVKTLTVEMTRTISPLKDLKAVWEFYKIFKKEKPEIVHTHTPKAGIIGMLAARLAKVPNRLHTVAGMPLLEATGGKRKILDWAEKITYRSATKVYPNSYGLYDIIVKNNYTTVNKLKVIGNGSSNGIDTMQFDPDAVPLEESKQLRTALGIAEEDFIYLFIGRLVRDKGINELVKAFEKIYSKYNNAHLVLVGPYEKKLDPLFPEVDKVIKEHIHIHSVGYQAQVVKYFAFANVLTFPSYREGFPNVVMQAAAMKLNIIASDINGCNEIVKDGQNGWLIPPKNTETLYQKMEWCLTNQEQSQEMGEEGRKIMMDKYERKYIWKEIYKEYLEVLKN